VALANLGAAIPASGTNTRNFGDGGAFTGGFGNNPTIRRP
jgi:hypothetical protein